MAEQPLLEREIVQGENLIRSIDEAQPFTVSSALWLSSTEPGADWKLVLGTPNLAKIGARGFYKVLYDLLKSSGIDLPFENIQLVDNNVQLLNNIRSIAKTSSGSLRANRFSNYTVNGITLPDAIIYRAS